MFYKCSDNFTHLPFTKDFLLLRRLLLRNNLKLYKIMSHRYYCSDGFFCLFICLSIV